jgi:hypothetical protein
MVYFTEFFGIDESVLSEYGAFNISLVTDLPLFIDPFLLFGSDKSEYQKLHEKILDYIIFLREKTSTNINKDAQIKAWYVFSEVKQNWLGYSKYGNQGSGLGTHFGKNFFDNINLVFRTLKRNQIRRQTTSKELVYFQLELVGIT